MIEPTRQVPENPLGLLGGRAVPGLTQSLLARAWQRRLHLSVPASPNSTGIGTIPGYLLLGDVAESEAVMTHGVLVKTRVLMA